MRLEVGEVGEQLCEVDRPSEHVLSEAPLSADVPGKHVYSSNGQLLIPATFQDPPIPARSAPPVMDSPEILRATLESNATAAHGFSNIYGGEGELKVEIVG